MNKNIICVKVGIFFMSSIFKLGALYQFFTEIESEYNSLQKRQKYSFSFELYATVVDNLFSTFYRFIKE